MPVELDDAVLELMPGLSAFLVLDRGIDASFVRRAERDFTWPIALPFETVLLREALL